MIRQSKKALTTDFPTRKVVFNTADYAPYILNSTASMLWDFCATARSDGEMTAYLQRTCGITAVAARKDIKIFIKELRKKGLIQTYGQKKRKK